MRALLHTGERTRRSIAVGNSLAVITGESGICYSSPAHQRVHIITADVLPQFRCVARLYCAEVRGSSRLELMYFEAALCITKMFFGRVRNGSNGFFSAEENLRIICSGKGWDVVVPIVVMLFEVMLLKHLASEPFALLVTVWPSYHFEIGMQ